MEEEVQLPESVQPVQYIDSDVEYEGGVTVQIVATHPFKPTSILWVLGKLETKPTNIKAFGYRPKPAAWSNPGGGMEERELEMFLDRFPDHPMVSLVSDDSLSLFEKNIICCGLREFIDETGYRDVEVFPYPSLYRYDRDDRNDNVSIFDFRYKSDHRVKTLFGHVMSFDVRDIVEKDEIVKARWLDLTMPLSRVFSDRIEYPLHPFVSHVRRLMITMHRVKRMSIFDDAPAYCRDHCADLADKIHSSWGLVFPVCAGDPRFPGNGFRLHRNNWYRLFYEIVARKIEFPDADFVYGLFGADIVEAKKREERMRECIDSGQERLLNEYTVSSGGHGHDNVPVNVLLNQDEEYRMWMERELGIESTN